ncbi:NUDIX domain-containing protein, partial [Candidatus Poribacteria bacterium]|nr:NUDIX domain-containing protein [Candidatus Poribacteria bacterium]
ADELLLVQRVDNDEWELPGGAAKVGEMPAQSVKREVQEETGLVVTPKKLIAVHDLRLGSTTTVYPHFYMLLFLCEVVSGTIALSNETKGIGYFPQDKLPSSLASYARRQADVAFAAHHRMDFSPQFD